MNDAQQGVPQVKWKKGEGMGILAMLKPIEGEEN